MSFRTHTTEVDGNHPYPDSDHILKQLGRTDLLKLGGFHLDDCVSRLAKAANRKGLEVEVDDDLTELFKTRILGKSHDFTINIYRPFNHEGYL